MQSEQHSDVCEKGEQIELETGPECVPGPVVSTSRATEPNSENALLASPEQGEQTDTAKEVDQSEIYQAFMEMLFENVGMKTLSAMRHWYDVTWRDLYVIPLSLLLYLADIGSDMAVAVRFFISHHWWYGGLTLAVVLVAAMANLCTDIMYKKEKPWRRYTNRWYHWLWLPVYLALGLEVPVMYWQNWRVARTYLGGCVWPLYRTPALDTQSLQVKIHQLRTFQYKYSLILVTRACEAWLEAWPQLALQIYIIAQGHEASWYQWAAVATSLAGYAATMYTQRKAFNITHKQRVSATGCLLYAVARAVPAGCRAAAVALALYSTWSWAWIVLPLICHYILAAAWWWYISLEYGWQRSVRGAALDGFMWLIEPFPHPAVHRSLIYGLAFLLEDVYLLTLWATAAQGPHYDIIWTSLLLATADTGGRITFALYCIFQDKLIEPPLY